jgi:hypothetical protein
MSPTSCLCSTPQRRAHYTRFPALVKCISAIPARVPYGPDQGSAPRLRRTTCTNPLDNRTYLLYHAARSCPRSKPPPRGPARVPFPLRKMIPLKTITGTGIHGPKSA